MLAALESLQIQKKRAKISAKADTENRELNCMFLVEGRFKVCKKKLFMGKEGYHEQELRNPEFNSILPPQP